jgi:putative sulfotransferase
MLSEHAGVASVFEWFSGLDPSFRFQQQPVAGCELAQRLRQDHPVCTEVLKRGYEIPEVVYPFGRSGMRYQKPGDPVPWNLGIAMPRLSDDPDALFDELLAMIDALPLQPQGAHYRTIFDWLTERLGRTAWVERSAGSIEFVGELDGCFPEARYVHLQRDGRETALSMREYPALRVAVVMMFGLAGDIEFSHEGLTEMAKTNGATIDRLLETRPPIELYGRYWAQQVEAGQEALASIDPSRVLDVRFDQMVASPLSELCRIRDFFELAGGDEWVERGAALVRGMPRLRYPSLSPDEQERLDAACAPATALLEKSPPSQAP